MADYGDPVKFPRTVFGSLQNVTLMQPFQNGCIISPKECKAGQKKKKLLRRCRSSRAVGGEAQ